MFTQRIVKNTLYQVVSRIGTSGITFLVAILIARNLGAAGYGDFTKVTTFVALFYLLLDFGFNAIFLQHSSGNKTHFRDLLYGRVAAGFALILLLSIVVWALPYQEKTLGFSGEVRLGIVIFSFSFLSQALLLSASAIFQKQLRYQSLMIASLFGSLVTLIMTFLFIGFTVSFVAMLVPLLFGSFVSGICALSLTKEKLIPIEMHKDTIKSFLQESWPLGLMLILNLVYFRIDIMLLSFLRPTIEVGIYGLAYRFFDFLIALPLFLSNALYPNMLSDQENFKNSFDKAKRYVFSFVLLSLPFMVACWIAAPFLSLIRQEYLAAVLPFRILLLSLPFFFVTNVLQWLLIARKQQRYLLLVYLLSAIITVTLNIVFIPSFSYIASAVITVIGEAIVLLLLLVKLFKK